MPNNNEQSQVIIANKPFLPIPPKIFLILGGFLLLSVLGFFSFRLFFLKPLPQPQASLVPEEPKITLPCPSIKKFCQEGQELVKDGRIEGIGAKIEANSPVLAVFDGTTVVRGYTLANEDSFTHLSLISDRGDLTAIYYFTKGSTKEGLVKKGQVIATDSGQLMKPFNDYSLMFLLLDKDHNPIPKERIIFE